MMGVELGYLIQFAIDGHVLSTSGVNRQVAFSWVYGLPDSPFQPSEKQQYGASFHTTVWDPWSPLLPNSYIVDQLWVSLPNTPGDVRESVHPICGGEKVCDRMPLNVCAYGQFTTDLRGRSFTGSKRIGPVCVSDCDGEELKPAAHMAFTNAMALGASPLVLTGVTSTITVQPVVWSRHLSASDLTIPPAIGAVITGSYLNKTLGQWKHRRERVVR